MPIDWTTRERALSLAYLFEATYHDENGVERMVHWCGPKARVGSGLSVPVPSYPGNERPMSCVWEARLTRASMDMTMGNIDQFIGAISDLSFNVDISGGSQASVPVPGDLRRDIVFGRWTNKECRLWILDLETGDTQVMGKGTLGRNPSSINANTFQLVMDINPLFPATLDWPQGAIPTDVDEVFTYPNSSGTHNYAPTQYMLNPDHAGKFLGLNFGNGSVIDDDYVWKELIPFGRHPISSSETYVFCWVSPQRNCYVSEVFYENTNGENVPLEVLSHSIETIEFLDPTMGPAGTCVRVRLPSTSSFNFVWYSPAGGAKSRMFARVKGTYVGQHSSYKTDTNGSHPVSLYSDTGTTRSAVWEVIEDVVSKSDMLNKPDALGTNAIAQFKASAPTVIDPNEFANLACVVPLDPSDNPIPAREALGTMAQFFPFDFAQRYDPISDDWRVYPLWRSSFNTPPSYIFGVEDMSRTDAPAVAQYDNADGKYANRVFVDVPRHYGHPTVASTAATSGGENNISPIIENRYQHSDTAEQGPTREGAVVTATVKPEHWLHYGSKGNSSASWSIGEERSQPQRTVQATHGVRSFRVEMGDAIQYDMVGINSDVGMVRKMRYDLDLQQVQITSYHIDHSTERSKPRENNVYYNRRRGTPPDVE
jgi:hypothetical protein